MRYLEGSTVNPFVEDETSTTPFTDDQFTVPVFFTVSETLYEWQDCIVPGRVLPVNDAS